MWSKSRTILYRVLLSLWYTWQSPLIYLALYRYSGLSVWAECEPTPATLIIGGSIAREKWVWSFWWIRGNGPNHFSKSQELIDLLHGAFVILKPYVSKQGWLDFLSIEQLVPWFSNWGIGRGGTAKEVLFELLPPLDRWANCPRGLKPPLGEEGPAVHAVQFYSFVVHII